MSDANDAVGVNVFVGKKPLDNDIAAFVIDIIQLSAHITNRRRKLGIKDSKAKEYFADNERFADLCNYVLYGGRCVIKAENLEERDTTEVLTALGLSLNMVSV